MPTNHSIAFDRLRSRLDEQERRFKSSVSELFVNPYEMKEESDFSSLLRSILSADRSPQYEAFIQPRGRVTRLSLYNGLLVLAGLYFTKLAALIGAILSSLTKLSLSRIDSPFIKPFCIEQTSHLVGHTASMVSFMHSSSGHPLYAHIRVQT